MKAAIYSQKKDLDTFLYLSKFISELNKRGVKAIIYEQLFKDLEFSKEFSTFSNYEDVKQEKIDFFARVRAKYLELASNNNRYKIINANYDLATIKIQLTTILDQYLNDHKLLK